VGAFAAEFGLIGMDSVKAAIDDEVPAKQEANYEAAVEAYGAVRSAAPTEVSHV
jgi:hypothetical protein